MPMTPQDLTICREIHAGLTSKERNTINYLFLEPVDVDFFADYKTIVKRPMDLGTLLKNLESNKLYSTKEEFYADAKLIGENAILFNKDRTESAWVVDLAKRLSKAFDRVRKTAEKRAARLSGETPPKKSSSGGSSSGKDEKKKSSSTSGGDAVKDGSSSGGGKKKKIKLTLKRQKSTSSMGGDTISSGGETAADAAPSSAAAAAPPPAVASSSDAKPAKKKTKVKLKLSAGLGGSSDAKKSSGDGSSSSKKTKIKLSAKPSSSSSAAASSSTKASAGDAAAGKYEDVPMTSFHRAQCCKIISSLKRRQPYACKWFMKPVTDPALVKDYHDKIKVPVNLSSLTSKLDKGQHKTMAEFMLDLRRISSNCLQYNTTIKDSFRPVATEFLNVSEDLCKLFLAKHEHPKVPYPSLLYCWEECVKSLDELLNILNPEDGHQAAWFFLQPVTFFCGGEYPEGYLEKVKNPMDLGTIVQNLITAKYTSVGAFVSDCYRVVDNCNIFYDGDPEGAPLCEKANRLKERMGKTLGQLTQFDQSEKGAKAREKASKSMVIKRPEKEFMRDVMRELRAATYTDKLAKITEKACLHFEKPVDTATFTDYLQFVETPMCLEQVDSKIEAGSYGTPEDFEYDITLIFKNCDRYNGPKKHINMVTLGKHTAKIFRKLFAEQMRGGSASKRPSLPTSANRTALGKLVTKKRPASPAPEERPSKRVSIKGPSKPSITSSASGKTASKKMGTKKIVRPPSKLTAPVDPKAPVPMHVAIASIKESYPGRRQNKDLEGWEAECLKFLRQLMKHPWVSAERTKYVFHVPVHFMFPNLREAYAAMIKYPMDLTTAEAKLLQGVYLNAEEYISDISLVFSNAILFNTEGHDVGEPMSCAYYEASTHLLKYIRWLSLEVLQSCLTDCSTSAVVESGSATEWKLTVRNREMARKEMEMIVFNEHVDKTEIGDRFSWTEQECEKLIKSLKHRSDAKRMMYFMNMSLLPPDYTAYIAKPIALDVCEDKLKHRSINKIGEVVEDLRLIFSNALKYNEGARHMSEISAEAYASAEYMSGKLEAAVDKMLLTAGERIGRERIDMITSSREMEAQERAAEEKRKNDWEKDNPGSTVEVKMKVRLVHQRSLRKKVTDFEFPFFDEEDGDHIDSHTDSVHHVKALYEKQREARATLEEIAMSISISVFRKHQESAAAKAWACEEARKAHVERMRVEKEKSDAAAKEKAKENPSKHMGACVSSALNDSNRKQIKMAFVKPKKMKRKLTFL